MCRVTKLSTIISMNGGILPSASAVYPNAPIIPHRAMNPSNGWNAHSTGSPYGPFPSEMCLPLSRHTAQANSAKILCLWL